MKSSLRELPLAAVLVLLLVVAAQPAHARISRANIACSLYVSPCHCGLCPNIVDCSKQATAECFCGTARPGIYAHPSDTTKFWMCSYNTHAQISYGVEVPCPSRLVFDPLVKVCTVPAAVTSQAPSTSQPASGAAAHGANGNTSGNVKAPDSSKGAEGNSKGAGSSQGLGSNKGANGGKGSTSPGSGSGALPATLSVGSGQGGGAAAYDMGSKGAVKASSSSSSSKKP